MRRGLGAIALGFLLVACESQPKVTASPSVIASPVSSAAALGAVEELALTPEAIYALYTAPGAQGKGVATARLARIDRASGSVLTIGPIPGALHVAVGGGWVWVGSDSLRRFDARTLVADSAFAPPREIQGPPSLAPLVAASATNVWLGKGELVLRLRPDTGAVIQRQTAKGPVSSLAVDSTGALLYVGANVSSGGAEATVTEYDAQTLQQLVSSPTGGAGLGGPHVAVSGSDVWIAYATGMLGTVEHRRASDLMSIPVAKRQFTNGILVYAAGRFIWASDAMASTLACLDPSTGAVRAIREVKFGGVVVGDRDGLYLGDVNGVSVLTPDPRC